MKDVDIEAHAREICTAEPLRQIMQNMVRRFVQFMMLLKRLHVVSFDGQLPGRTLLGYKAIVVRDAHEWQAVLSQSVAAQYFSGVFTVYDFFLMWGFSATKEQRKFPRPTGLVFSKSTHKKSAVVYYGSLFVFRATTLANNVKRYTNNRERNPVSEKDFAYRLTKKCNKSVKLLLAAARDIA